MSQHQKRTLARVLVALALFFAIMAVGKLGFLDVPGGLWIEFGLYLIPYLIAGYDVLGRAVHGIAHGRSSTRTSS